MTRVIRAGEGEVLGPVRGCRDRFLVDSSRFGGRIGVVEHLLAPSSIAAPMHRHSREDEFSFIIEGRVWFHAAGQEVEAAAGDLVFKPRGEWHTFWNSSEKPARILELISPGGLEHAFRRMDTGEAEIPDVVAEHAIDVDFETTEALVRRHGLTFGED